MNHQDLTLLEMREDLIEHLYSLPLTKVVCHKNSQEVDSLDDEIKVIHMQQGCYDLHNPLRKESEQRHCNDLHEPV